MATLIWFSIVFAAAAGTVFYQEQINPPTDVTDLSAILFLLGLLVRMTLAVVLVTLIGLSVGALWS